MSDPGGSESSLDHALRYVHPLRLSPLLPGIEKLAAHEPATLYGVDGAAFEAARERLRIRKAAAIERLNATREFDAFVEHPRLKRGDVLLALGDSLTDDSLSWFELIRGAIERRMGAAFANLVNAGVSGSTTSDARSRLIPLLDVRPAWVVFMIGTNDARRHGWNQPYPLHTISQTQENLAALVGLTAEKTGAVQVWLTPPPVLEGRQHDDPLLRDQEIWWGNRDLREIASSVRRLDATIVDLWPDFTGDHAELLYEDDGVHLAVEGQLVVARRVLSRLTDR